MVGRCSFHKDLFEKELSPSLLVHVPSLLRCLDMLLVQSEDRWASTCYVWADVGLAGEKLLETAFQFIYCYHDHVFDLTMK